MRLYNQNPATSLLMPVPLVLWSIRARVTATERCYIKYRSVREIGVTTHSLLALETSKLYLYVIYSLLSVNLLKSLVSEQIITVHRYRNLVNRISVVVLHEISSAFIHWVVLNKYFLLTVSLFTTYEMYRTCNYFNVLKLTSSGRSPFFSWRYSSHIFRITS